MKLAIDYSLNSPAFCVFNADGNEITPVRFYFFAKKKCQIGSFHNGLFVGRESKEPDPNPVVRYLTNANYAMEIVDKYSCDSIYIEGYSYGSVTSSFTSLVENVATLKVLAHQRGIELIPFAPSAVKKIATGKGNAKKAQMYEDGWLKRFDIDLETMLGAKRDANPISDIVDSYFVGLKSVL